MKITVEPKAFADAVAWAARALAAKPTVPALSGLLLTAEAGDVLTASAFDYDMSARERLTADVAEPGQVLVSGRVLAKVADGLADSRSYVEIALSGQEVLIRCGAGEYVLAAMRVEDYPTLPGAPAALGAVDGALLKTALGQVLPAADPDSAQPFLTAVQMVAGSEGLGLTATDTGRVAHRVLVWQPVLDGPELSMLIPARTLQEFARGLSAGDVEVGGDGKLASFTAGDRQVTMRLLDAGFPNWKRALEVLSERVVADIPVHEVAGAVKRVRAVADKDAAICLAFEPQMVTVSVSGEGKRGAEAVECSVEGGSIALTFAQEVLADGLASVEGERATFGLNAPGKGALLRGADSSYWYMAMPLRVS